MQNLPFKMRRHIHRLRSMQQVISAGNAVGQKHERALELAQNVLMTKDTAKQLLNSPRIEHELLELKRRARQWDQERS